MVGLVFLVHWDRFPVVQVVPNRKRNRYQWNGENGNPNEFSESLAGKHGGHLFFRSNNTDGNNGGAVSNGQFCVPFSKVLKFVALFLTGSARVASGLFLFFLCFLCSLGLAILSFFLSFLCTVALSSG